VTDFIEFDPVDDIAAGAFGRPGQRTFVIQARKGSAVLSVLVEKEQVRHLAEEARQFLDRIATEEPEEAMPALEVGGGAVREDEPLFRARLIGIGYDAERALVLIELREDAATARRGRGSHRPPVRNACADPRDDAQRSRRGRGRSSSVPVVRFSDEPRRAHLSALELTSG